MEESSSSSSSSSVAALRNRLQLSHIRQPVGSSPPATTTKRQPPPPPSVPPRKPSTTTTTITSPLQSPVSPSKLEERNLLLRMDHHHQTPSSPPPYAPPLPSRQNSSTTITPTPAAPPRAPPPQLPPRLPPRTAPKPKPETFAHSLLKKKPTPRPPGQARPLPPPVIPAPPPPNSWAKPKNDGPRRPSITPTDSSVVPPPLPPTAAPSLPPRKSLPSLRPLPSTSSTLAVPPLPKRTPSQPSIIHPTIQPEEPPIPRRNILSMGFGGQKGKLPSPPPPAPPPVPVSTRPPPINPSTKPPPLPAARPAITTASTPSSHTNNGISNGNNSACLKCRDFSLVDAHAAKFPRHAYDDVHRLALDLTRNFPSHTDKARVLFTWLHHNVRYDVEAFFNNTVQRSTPASTLRTGLAVCEGFAGLFAAMAVYSGLEAIVVGGHGKGYGWSGPNSASIPPGPTGHAWNAVRIDNGVWQTIDPCWGAGYLCGGEYKQVFSPHHFTETNEEFRRTHYPENPDHQFCAQPITWREYYLMEEGPQLYSTISEPEYDYGRYTVEPGVKVLQPYTRYRFRVAKSCEHQGAQGNWVLMINNGQDEETMMPDGRGGFVAELSTGAAGEQTQLRVLTMYNEQSAKGMTIDQWKSKRGARSWSYSGLCTWEVK